MSRTKTQKQKIVEYIDKYGSISQLEAYLDLGCWRLATRIFELKREGYDIQSELKEVTTRDGSKTKIAVYSWRVKANETTSNSLETADNSAS